MIASTRKKLLYRVQIRLRKIKLDLNNMTDVTEAYIARSVAHYDGLLTIMIYISPLMSSVCFPYLVACFCRLGCCGV